MTRKEAIARLKECAGEDAESGHVDADNVLCELLYSLGYEDVVAEWGKIRQWYA